MSEENVEHVREGWLAYARGGIDATLEFFTPDCVCEDFLDLPDHTVHRGREGARAWYSTFAAMWDDLVIDLQETIDAGGDVVVAVASVRGRGKGSGALVETVAAWVYEVRDGGIARARAFTSREAALGAAGLEA